MTDATPTPTAPEGGWPALWADAPLAVVDVETTGLDPTTDRVIEIGIVHMRAGRVEKVWETLIDPGVDIPHEVVNITGIQPEELVGKPKFADVADLVAEHLEGRALCAYNLAFDRAFVKHELERAGRAWRETHYIDPLIFVRHLHEGKGSKRLGAVAERLGVVLNDAHRAAADAIAAGEVLYKLAPELPAELDALLVLQAQWETQQQNKMAGWRNRKGQDLGTVSGGVGGTGVAAERGNALGPAYLYSQDTDPVRFMFADLPSSGSRR